MICDLFSSVLALNRPGKYGQKGAYLSSQIRSPDETSQRHIVVWFECQSGSSLCSIVSTALLEQPHHMHINKHAYNMHVWYMHISMYFYTLFTYIIIYGMPGKLIKNKILITDQCSVLISKMWYFDVHTFQTPTESMSVW